MLTTSRFAQTLHPDLSPSNKKRINDYLFDASTPLGKGSFSTVYPGHHLHSQQTVAVKVIKMSSINTQKLQQLLQQQIDIACSLSHPNIIRCFEVLKSVNHCYLITELCPQGTLETLIREKGPISQPQLWPIARDIYQGLKYLSTQGIVHRDIKSANVFLREGALKIADFGFAVRAPHHFKDINIGSPLYMAPQAYIHNLYGPKTDIWAFGIVLYELLHGRTPNSHCIQEADLRRNLERGVAEGDLRRDISPELRELLLRCLTVNQERRISIDQIQQTDYFQINSGMKPPKMQFTGLKRIISSPVILKYRRDVSPIKETVTPKASQDNKIILKRPFHKKKQSQYLNFTLDEKQKGFTGSCGAQSTDSSRRSNTERINEILRGKITFNESIGLINLCRVGFKLLSTILPQLLKRTIKKVIISILGQILIKVDINDINYELREAQQAKRLKLKTVVEQYIHKYNSTELIPSHQPVNLSALRKMGLAALQQTQLKAQTQPIVYEMYLLCIFLNYINYLRHSDFGFRQYKAFAEDTVLESCHQQRNTLTYQQYNQYRSQMNWGHE